MGLFLFGSAVTIFIKASKFERAECVEGYRFYATMYYVETNGNYYYFDVYEDINMCDEYRAVGGLGTTKNPTCYDIKKEDHRFYVYRGSWHLLNRN